MTLKEFIVKDDAEHTCCFTHRVYLLENKKETVLCECINEQVANSIRDACQLLELENNW